MSFGIGQQMDELDYGDSDSWGGPMGGVDINAQAGIEVGSGKWHARMTTDLWSVLLILGALAGLWFLGGVVFKSVRMD